MAFNNNHKIIGTSGEDRAEQYLLQNGFTILARNFTTNFGELDIICQKDKNIYFYEVKFRNNKSFGYGEEAIDKRKIKKLSKTIYIWLSQNLILYKNYNIYLNALVIDENFEIHDYEIL